MRRRLLGFRLEQLRSLWKMRKTNCLSLKKVIWKNLLKSRLPILFRTFSFRKRNRLAESFSDPFHSADRPLVSKGLVPRSICCFLTDLCVTVGEFLQSFTFCGRKSPDLRRGCNVSSA